MTNAIAVSIQLVSLKKRDDPNGWEKVKGLGWVSIQLVSLKKRDVKGGNMDPPYFRVSIQLVSLKKRDVSSITSQ